MAKTKRTIPSSLGLHKKAYQTVAFHGVPMWRAQAWALYDFEVHNWHHPLIVSSGDRRDGVAERFGHMGQGFLYHAWITWRDHGVAVKPFTRSNPPLPANPPGHSSHEIRSDGMPFYHAPNGAKIENYMLGIDAGIASDPNNAALIVGWLNSHGYEARRIYPAASEKHHFSFAKSPATHARWRLARWVATGK